MSQSNSVVVVGAGLAGLFAAKLLQPHYKDVLVLEATDRPGGRVRQAGFSIADLIFNTTSQKQHCESTVMSAGGRGGAMACGGRSTICTWCQLITEGAHAAAAILLCAYFFLA